MMYITINAQNNVTEAIDSDRQAIPGGAIQLTSVEYEMIRTHPVGFSAYDYIGGALVENVAAVNVRTLKMNRLAKIRDIKAHAFGLIGGLIPALDNESSLDLMVQLWPMLDTSKASVELRRVKNIYQLARTRIGTARTATQAQLDAYDVTTDNWP